MLVMGRDHKLYYEAYNDAVDLNGDGTIDVGYNPNIDYYGYFDSYKCYTYLKGQRLFKPSVITSNKKCNGNHWSGDFLNYLTTSRIDALRKILYGGLRSEDGKNRTVLERAHIPQDGHSWGKEYTSPTADGYDIRDYTPYRKPSTGKHILFANTTLKSGNGLPLLRVADNVRYRIWEWVSIERPVAGDRVLNGTTGPLISEDITDHVVRVEVCHSKHSNEDNCQLYPNGKYKPVGILQKLGEKDAMKFGLISGSYSKNLSGGVLRKNIGSINDEINAETGQFTSKVGIINTINRLRTVGFGGPKKTDYYYYQNCGWITNRYIYSGECRMWGNPIAEMMYEALRYFAGKSSPTAAYTYSGGDDALLGLPTPTWQNPYTNTSNPWCAQANMLVITDPYPSYDADELPGSYFGSFSGDLTDLDVAALGQKIWQQEIGSNQSVLIGQSGKDEDGAPTAKTVNSFGNIRGLAAEPTSQGSYYAASVAYYGRINDISAASGTQNVYTYVVTLPVAAPVIKIPVGQQEITLTPFAKTVEGQNIYPARGNFQPTDAVVDFYVEDITDSSGSFRVNFDDLQQGGDYDMDAVVFYSYQVNANHTVTITVNSDYAHGSFKQHLGYIISGTSADGIYLVVRDQDTKSNKDIDYFLDVTGSQNIPGLGWKDYKALPLSSTRTFTPGNSSTITSLQDPLWYAAKWGGFIDDNDNLKPDLTAEWDTDQDSKPDNYFLSNNADKLNAQLSHAFNQILKQAGSTASVALNSNSFSTNSKLYQVSYDSEDWSGELLAFNINNDGSVNATKPGSQGTAWRASQLLKRQNNNSRRQIITYKPSTDIGIPFRWPQNIKKPKDNELDKQQVKALNTNPVDNKQDNLGKKRLNYLRGSQADEQKQGGTLRNRDNLLGDIINSTPYFVGTPAYPYSLRWPDGTPETTASYSNFKIKYANRTPVIYVGSNDGMLHGFNANSGQEIFAYIPSSVFTKLSQLTDKNYGHQFYVDGAVNSMDVFFKDGWHTVLVGGLNSGGYGIYALDITNPGKFTEENADKIVLWEFSDEDNDAKDIGLTFSQPAIARMANGRWAAIFGNGYNNTLSPNNPSHTGDAILYIVDIETGKLIKKFDTKTGSAQDPLQLYRPNGLTTPLAVDINGNNIVDYIYVGDLFGNLWKMNVQDSKPAQWNFAFSSGSSARNKSNTPEKPLFTAKDASGNQQPITSHAMATKYKGSILAIAFGTGKYLEPGDRSNTDTQSFYTVFDDHTTPITGRSQLLSQSISDELIYTRSDNVQNKYRVTTDAQLTNSHRGWFIDLIYNNQPVGERIIADPVSSGGKIIFSTMIPTADPCGYGGDSWLMALDAITGSRLEYTPFDVRGDDNFNEQDFVTTTSDNKTIKASVSGIQSTVGITATPTLLSGGIKDYLYLTGTSGGIQMIVTNPGQYASGRQSWRQLK